MDRKSLRQGDVVCGLLVIKPSAKPKIVSELDGGCPFLGDNTKVRIGQESFGIYTLAKLPTFCVVLNQCCELEIRGEQCKSRSIILSPLGRLNLGESKEMDALRSNDLQKNLSKYYFAKHKALPSEMVADLTNMFSVDRRNY